jgi:glucose-6-phosphate-specific signal transduction histidine kinase
MRNALRHAAAMQIEVELRYDERQLRLRVRDNGKGIDPTHLGEQGRQGHFGLHGMRERAELIGGKLTRLFGTPAVVNCAAMPLGRFHWAGDEGRRRAPRRVPVRS